MDVDLMKPSAQDQMEMMTMMMQLDRLPHELSAGHYSSSSTTTTSELQEMDFSGGSAATVDTPAPIFHHNPPSSIPFLSSPVQEPIMTSLGLAPNAVTPRFRTSNPSDQLSSTASYLQRRSSTEAMREMIFRIAVMQPVHIDPESVKPPKRRNVKISKDPQSVAARHRRERISERIRILQRLVPGGTKMDTASMLDEAIHYVKFLKKQVQSLEQAGVNRQMGASGVGFPTTAMVANMNYSSMVKACQPSQMVGSTHMLR